MPRRRGQFSYSSKIATNNNKGYLAGKIRQMKKVLRPPQLAGVGLKSRRSGT